MKFSILALIISIIPVVAQGMLMRLAPISRLSPRCIERKMPVRTNSSWYGENFPEFPALRKIIAEPDFSIPQVQEAVNQELTNKGMTRYKKDQIIPHIVCKATQYKEAEFKYAQVLNVLCLKNWTIKSTMTEQIVPEAVKSDLFYVTQELLSQSKKAPDVLNYFTDADGRTLLHYAKSEKIARLLLEYGLPVNAQDVTGSTPLHVVNSSVAPALLEYNADITIQDRYTLFVPECGWFALTPLRKAVYDGNLTKVCVLLNYIEAAKKLLSDEEEKILFAIANLQKWRTKDEIYFYIKVRLADKYYPNATRK